MVSIVMRLSICSAALFLAWSLTACDVQRDMQDARTAAARVHSQMQSGDYAAIYRESAPRFKSVGDESRFVSQMQQFFEDSGKFVKAQEVSYTSGIDTNAGRTHTLNFIVDYQLGQGREQMIFTRSTNGTMQLWKLDIDPKK